MAFGGLRGTLTGTANSITNPFAVTGSVAVSIGDLVYAVFGEQTTLTVGTVTDNLGHTYTALNAGTDAGQITGRAYYARITTAGTLTSVSAVATASADNVAAGAVVIEGPFATSPLDANPANITSDAASPFTCPSTGTLAQAPEVVIAWGAANYGTAWAATSPNLLGTDQNSQTSAKIAIGYQLVAATTAVQPAFTAASNPTQAILGVASFKANATADAVSAGTSTIAATGAATTAGAPAAAGTSTNAATGVGASIGAPASSGSSRAVAEAETGIPVDGYRLTEDDWGRITEDGADYRIIEQELAEFATGDPASAGTSTVQAVGASTAAAVADSDGASTTQATGASTAAAAPASAGTSTVQATGVAIFAGAASSAGTSTAQATGAATAAAAGSSAGTSTVAAVGTGVAPAAPASAGTSTTQATGASVAAANGDSAGTSTTQAIGASTGAGAPSSVGTSTGHAVGTGIVFAAPHAEGTSTAQAQGFALAEGSASAEAHGTSTTQAVGASLAAASGAAAGTSTCQAVGVAIRPNLAGTGPPAPPPRRVDGVADGEVVAAFVGLRPGRAASISLLTGAVRGELNITVTVGVTLEPGTATGEITISDEELLLLLEAA